VGNVARKRSLSNSYRLQIGNSEGILFGILDIEERIILKCIRNSA